MTPRTEALEAARFAARSIGETFDERIRARRAHPYPWMRFHQRMAQRLPKIRWLARAWHRMMARRMEAMVWARGVREAKRCGLA